MLQVIKLGKAQAHADELEAALAAAKAAAAAAEADHKDRMSKVCDEEGQQQHDAEEADCGSAVHVPEQTEASTAESFV